jgi:hypothetical protein
VRDPATRPAVGDRIIGFWGERRVAWVTEGLTHTIVGLVDEKGNPTTVSYYGWAALIHEADTILPAGEDL